MKKNIIRKCILVLLAIVLVIETSCSNSSNPNDDSNFEEDFSKLVIWSCVDDSQLIVDRYYKKDYPNIEIEYSYKSEKDLFAKLNSNFSNGERKPDAIILSDTYIRNYVEKGDEYLLDLTDIYKEIKESMVSYSVEIGFCNGKIYGLSYHIKPAAMFYRRSLSKKYIGTDDPTEVQKAFANWSKFKETASLLGTKSNQNCKIVSSIDDIYSPYLASRTQPWIVGGKLMIDAEMLAYMDTCKDLYSKKHTFLMKQYSDEWMTGVRGMLPKNNGSTVEVFSYFLSETEFQDMLKKEVRETSGDWAMIQGPVPYHKGGAWVVINKKAKAPTLARKFVKYVISNNAFMENWAKDTGYLVANNTILNKIKANCSDEFLGGQNYYDIINIANALNGNLLQGSDYIIENLWNDAVWSYVKNDKSKEEAIADFKDQVKATLGYSSN